MYMYCGPWIGIYLQTMPTCKSANISSSDVIKWPAKKVHQVLADIKNWLTSAPQYPKVRDSPNCFRQKLNPIKVALLLGPSSRVEYGKRSHSTTSTLDFSTSTLQYHDLSCSPIQSIPKTLKCILSSWSKLYTLAIWNHSSINLKPHTPNRSYSTLHFPRRQSTQQLLFPLLSTSRYQSEKSSKQLHDSNPASHRHSIHHTISESSPQPQKPTQVFKSHR